MRVEDNLIRQKIFSRRKAIENNNTAVDVEGRAHSIIFTSSKFTITECNGEEYCFDENGFNVKAGTRLISPVHTLVSIPKFIAFNIDTGQIVGISDRPLTMYEDMIVMNTTHHSSRDKLLELGFSETSWIEE